MLIVEDEAPLREVLVRVLKGEGFSVHQAANGEEGLALARKDQPTAILLDIAMPRMDGLTMLDHLRKESEWGRSVPVLILTNLNADDKILRNIMENQPAYYLVKADWHADEIVQRVRECVHRSRRPLAVHD